MSAIRHTRTLTMAVAVVGLCSLTAPTLSMATTATSPLPAQANTHDVTSLEEAKRVDSVNVGTPVWKKCGIAANQECANIDVPMDYDNPTGPKMTIGAKRNKTSKPGQKKGDLYIIDRSLGSTRATVESPEDFLSADIMDNFDIVGIDPRGTLKVEYTGVQCFKDIKEQIAVINRLNMSYPSKAADQDTYLRFAQFAGQSCSTKGMPIVGHQSVAQQARDLDVMRRAFSNDKINIFTTQEGGQIAQTYAALFPDRVRAIYVNDATDPVKYNGGAGQHALRTVRTGQDVAAKQAMDRFFAWCDKKGAEDCSFAKNAPEGTAKKFEKWFETVNANPVITGDPDFPFNGSGAVNTAMGGAMRGNAPAELGYKLQRIWELTNVARSASAGKAARQELTKVLAEQRAHVAGPTLRQDPPSTPAPSTPAPQPPADEELPPGPQPYFNYIDNWLIGKCNEGQQVSDVKFFKDQIAEVNRRSAMFGEKDAWVFAACTSNAWTGVDTRQYKGDFAVRPATPVLYGTSRFSPLHNYENAQSASQRLKGSVLITNEGWGANSYFSSRCLSKMVDSYLIDGKLPAGNQTCEPDWKE